MAKLISALLLACLWPSLLSAQSVFLSGHSGIPNGIPNPCVSPTIRSVTNGAWESASTWDLGRVPTSNDRVFIAPGNLVTLSSEQTATLTCLQIEGTLNFSTTQNTRLRVTTLITWNDGWLVIGTAQGPVQPQVSASINWVPGPMDTEQYWGGLLGLNGHVVTHGAAKPDTFIRLCAEPLIGQNTLNLCQTPIGWRVGDEVAIPDTRALTENQRFGALTVQSERALIVAISGNQLTLDRPLSFNHFGARDYQGTLRFLPHVANFTRNIKLISEQPTGVRGHGLFTHRVQLDMRYTELRGMGRTLNGATGSSNQVGRYPMHLHHLMGPVNPTNTGYQATLIGNAFIDSRRWAVTVHNTHYALIQDNTCGWADGWCYGTEDGNESFNEFVDNLGMAVFGDADPRQIDGAAASVFWFRGFNHDVGGNVAAAPYNHQQSISSGVGFDFSSPVTGYQTVQRIPKARGLDTTVAGNFFNQNLMCTPVRRFENNEAYGVMALGLTIWNLGTDGYNNVCPSQALSTFTGINVWHMWSGGFFGYPSKQMFFDNWTVIGQPGAAFTWCFWADDYKLVNVRIRNMNCQGTSAGGIDVGRGSEGTWTVESPFVRSRGLGISVTRANTPGTGAQVGPRTTTVSDADVDQWPGFNFQLFGKSDTGSNQQNPNTSDTTFLVRWQRNPNLNYQAYYTIQGSQAVAGGLAPCQTTLPEMTGFFCSTGSTSLSTPLNLIVQ